MYTLVSSAQSLSRVWLFATPRAVAHQASPSITNYWNLLKLGSIESVMPSNHLTLCRPLLLCLQSFPADWSKDGGYLNWAVWGHPDSRALWLLGSVKEDVNKSRKMEKGAKLWASKTGPQTDEPGENGEGERTTAGFSPCKLTKVQGKHRVIQNVSTKLRMSGWKMSAHAVFWKHKVMQLSEGQVDTI